MSDKKVQDKKAQQFFCPKCDKIYGAKSNLARHCVSAHRWSLTLSAPIMDQEKNDLFDVEPDKGASQSSVQEESNEAESRSAEVDAAVQSLLATEGIAITGEQKASDAATEEPLAGTSGTSSSTARTRVQKTWAESIAPLGQSKDPTKRKQTIIKQPYCPPKRTSSLAIKESVAKWPNRVNRPPIRDVIGYRKSLPTTVTPAEIGELARERFGWSESRAIAPHHYVQGVISAYDEGRRSTLRTLKGYLRIAPGQNPEDRERLQWIRNWVEGEHIPDSPKQDFLD